MGAQQGRLLGAVVQFLKSVADFAGGKRQKACFGSIVKTGFLLVALAVFVMRPQAETQTARPIRAGVRKTPGCSEE
jgi:hypothetical protein